MRTPTKESSILMWKGMKVQMEEKFKYIFSLKLAGFLMQNGQRIIRINHNLNVPDKDVYVFIDTPELCQLMSEYSNQNKNSKEKYYAIDKRSRNKS
jgi:hypothetical protein